MKEASVCCDQLTNRGNGFSIINGHRKHPLPLQQSKRNWKTDFYWYTSRITVETGKWSTAEMLKDGKRSRKQKRPAIINTGAAFWLSPAHVCFAIQAEGTDELMRSICFCPSEMVFSISAGVGFRVEQTEQWPVLSVVLICARPPKSGKPDREISLLMIAGCNSGVILEWGQ